MNLFKILSFILIIAIVSTIALFYFVYNEIPNDTESKIRFEIIKSLLGIISVAIIGGFISSMLKSYEKSQEDSRIRIQAKINFMKRTDELYRIVKSSRRKLIANSVKESKSGLAIPIGQEQIQIYLKEMDILNNIQLELEGIGVSVKNYKLFNYSPKISEYLYIMEKYLREILKESEVNFMILKRAEYIDINQLPFLKDFTSDRNMSNFQSQFSNSYYKILSHLS